MQTTILPEYKLSEEKDPSENRAEALYQEAQKIQRERHDKSLLPVYLARAAGLGHPLADKELKSGRGMEQVFAQAILGSYALHYPEAFLYLAKLYREGFGTEKDSGLADSAETLAKLITLPCFNMQTFQLVNDPDQISKHKPEEAPFYKGLFHLLGNDKRNINYDLAIKYLVEAEKLKNKEYSQVASIFKAYAYCLKRKYAFSEDALNPLVIDCYDKIKNLPEKYQTLPFVKEIVREISSEAAREIAGLRNQQLWKQLLDSIVKYHQSASSPAFKETFLLVLQDISKFGIPVKDNQCKFDINKAWTDCLLQYPDRVHMKEAMKACDQLEQIAATVNTKLDVQVLCGLYKKFADLSKAQGFKEDAIIAYNRAGDMGDAGCITEATELDQKLIPISVEKFRCLVGTADEKSIDIILQHILYFNQQCNLPPNQKQSLEQSIVSAFEKFPLTLQKSTVIKYLLQTKNIKNPFSFEMTHRIIANLIKTVNLNEVDWVPLLKNYYDFHHKVSEFNELDAKLKIHQLKMNKDKLFNLNSPDQAMLSASAHYLTFARDNNEAAMDFIIENFRPILKKIGNEANIFESKFEPFVSSIESLENFQKELLPEFLDTLLKNTDNVKEPKKQLHALLTLFDLNNKLCQLTHDKDPHAMRSIDICNKIFALKEINPRENALIEHLKNLAVKHESSTVKSAAYEAVLKKDAKVFRKEQNLDFIMAGAKSNHPEAIYRLSRHFEADKTKTAATLYLKAKFIVLAADDKSSATQIKECRRFIRHCKKNAATTQLARPYESLLKKSDITNELLTYLARQDTETGLQLGPPAFNPNLASPRHEAKNDNVQINNLPQPSAPPLEEDIPSEAELAERLKRLNTSPLRKHSLTPPKEATIDKVDDKKDKDKKQKNIVKKLL